MRSMVKTVVIACALLAGTGVCAQTYPSKSVRFVVGFPPGGSNDIVTRLLAQKLTETMGQTFIVDNRGGANTAIATELVARAVPDGYTILLNARRSRDQPGAHEVQLRFGEGFRLHLAGRGNAEPARRASVAAGAQREGADRGFEEKSRGS